MTEVAVVNVPIADEEFQFGEPGKVDSRAGSFDSQTSKVAQALQLFCVNTFLIDDFQIQEIGEFLQKAEIGNARDPQSAVIAERSLGPKLGQHFFFVDRRDRQ